MFDLHITTFRYQILRQLDETTRRQVRLGLGTRPEAQVLMVGPANDASCARLHAD